MTVVFFSGISPPGIRLHNLLSGAGKFDHIISRRMETARTGFGGVGDRRFSFLQDVKRKTTANLQ